MRLLLLCLILAAYISGCSEKETPPPNIIYILADDLGYGDIGPYGQQKILTPNIDALARSGMIFTQHYSGSPVCAPSRYMLMTGKHPGHAYIRGNDEWGHRGEVWNYAKAVEDPNLEGQRPMPAETPTIARVLQDAGYKTGMIGKWGLGAPLSDAVPNTMGFDFFYGYNCQRQAHNLYPRHLWKNREKVWLDNEVVPPGTKLADSADLYARESYDLFYQKEYAPELMHGEALNFMRENKESPFFLYYATPIPHLPLQVPEEYVMKYVEILGDEEPYDGKRGYFPHRYPNAAYAAMISYFDMQVGELISELKSLGLYENTLVILTSDNGPTYTGGVDAEYFNSGGIFPDTLGRTKGFVYEGGIRVPMIASWPDKIKAGTTTEHISAFWDVMPTLADLVGGQAPEGIDGVSFLPTLVNEGMQQEREYLYWEIPEYRGQQAVRMGQWKGIRKNIKQGNLTIELYNLNEDPAEEFDISGDYPDIVRRIEEIMDKEHNTPEIERFRMEAIDSEQE